MRHRKAGRKFGMNATARKAMFRNMVTSLLLHEQIRTTQARAKELRGYAERIITLGKTAPSLAQIEALSGADLQKARAKRVHLIRRAQLWVNNTDALDKVFGEYADRFAERPGGYTRVLKIGRRAGDSAAMAVIQLVEPIGEDVPSEELGDSQLEGVADETDAAESDESTTDSSEAEDS